MSTLVMSTDVSQRALAAEAARVIQKHRNRHFTQEFDTVPPSVQRARDIAKVLRGCGLKASARGSRVAVREDSTS
jgi:hypothetical protein